MEQAVTNGSVQAAVAGEPFLTIAELHGLQVIKEVPDPALIVLASEKFLSKQPEAVKKFIKGHQEAITFIQQNKEAAAEALVKAFNVPKTTDQAGKTWEASEVLKKALERHTFDYKITDEDLKFYQEVADYNHQLKMIDNPFDVKTLFDTSWIQ
jgi:NitT/TauT family transport system substrate-binding protein